MLGFILATKQLTSLGEYLEWIFYGGFRGHKYKLEG